MAKNPQKPAAPRAPRSPQERDQPPAARLASDQQTLDRTDAEKRADEAREADGEKARALAAEQREAHARGETGQGPADELKGEDGNPTVMHSITDPEAAPVDYTKATMRRAPHTPLPPSEADPRAVAVSPYGAEPRSIDLATGLPIVPPAANALNAAETPEEGEEGEDADKAA